MPSNNPEREFAVEVVQRLTEAGFTALWAGGCVRDFLLGQQPKDYDVATDARPDDVRRVFGHRQTLAVGESFGVIIVRGPRGAGQVEVATFRSEGPYSDGRHPDSVAFATAEEDAQRRDFTINGMFYDPLGDRVLDYVGGEADLKQRVIRAIGRPGDRMTEDKLRMLRAVRFAATLDFTLDPLTADAIRGMSEQLHAVSAERIAEELRRMLVDPHRRRAVELARDVGLLLQIVPELSHIVAAGPVAGQPGPSSWQTTLQMLDRLDAPSFELATAVLLHSLEPPKSTDVADDSATIRGICRRLKLSNQESELIVWLVAHRDDLREAPELPLCRLKRILAHPFRNDLIDFARARASVTGEAEAAVGFCCEYLAKTPWEKISPPALLSGDDLLAHGLDAGPQFKTLLDRVRDAQLNGEIHDRHAALALVDRLIAVWNDDKKDAFRSPD